MPRLVLLIILGLTTLAASDSAATRTDQRIAEFEALMDRSFVPVERNLQAWRDKHTRGAVRELQDLLKVAGPEDQAFLAYHLLSHNPKDKAVRDLFTKVGLQPPFDEQGVPTPGWRTPICTNRTVVEKVTALAYPPFDAVAEAIGLRNSAASSYWRKLSKEMADLRADLVQIAGDPKATNAADTVFPVLAYYHPESREAAFYYQSKGRKVPRQKVWFNPVDRWLLENELAGLDALVGPDGKPRSGGPAGVAVSDQAWGFPEYLRGARFELVGTARLPITVRFLDLHHRGAAVTVTATGVEVRPGDKNTILATFPIDVDLSATPLPVQIEARGKTVSAKIGGVTVGSINLADETAYYLCQLQGSVQAQSLRIRYLTATDEADLLGLVATGGSPSGTAAPAKPDAPAWKADRDRQLSAPLTVAFSETSLEEVASTLRVLTGVEFRLDPSAEPLKDLPVTLSTDDLPLGKTLEWLQRLTDIRAQADDRGFLLLWQP